MAIHHGRNIRRFREMRDMNQDDLAERLGESWNQKKISQLESEESIDAQLVKEIARILNIAPEFIEKLNEEGLMQFFNTFNENSGAGAFIGNNSGTETSFNTTVNPLEKYVEMVDKYSKLVEEHKVLYDQLLKVEREKFALLEKVLKEK